MALPVVTRPSGFILFLPFIATSTTLFLGTLRTHCHLLTTPCRKMIESTKSFERWRDYGAFRPLTRVRRYHQKAIVNHDDTMQDK